MNAQVNREENTFWPWVLGLVVLALVVWVVAEVSGEPGTAAPEPAVVAAPVTRTTGESLQLWVRDSAEMQERTGDGGSYAVAGMMRVSSALRTLTAGDTSLSARAENIAAGAARLDSIAVPEERVVALQGLFEESVSVLEARTGAGTTEALQRLFTDAREAAAELDPDLPLEQQRHRVFGFFDHISEAVRVLEGPVES